MDTFTMKQNDTRPKLVTALIDKFGEAGEAAIDLTTAKKVKLVVRKKGTTGEAKFKKECALTEKSKGIVTYTWEASDTSEIGEFDIEFEIEWEDGGIETIPNKNYGTLTIVDDLG